MASKILTPEEYREYLVLVGGFAPEEIDERVRMYELMGPVKDKTPKEVDPFVGTALAIAGSVGAVAAGNYVAGLMSEAGTPAATAALGQLASGAAGAGGAATAATGAAGAGSGLGAPTVLSAKQIPLAGGAAPVEGGFFSAAAPYAAGALGALGAYDLSKDFGKTKPGMGTLQGAASGAGLGFSVGGPVGAAIGAGIGGIGGLASDVVSFGDKDRWQGEMKRQQALANKYPEIVATGYKPISLSKGRSKEELVNIEQEKIGRGEYGNLEFAKTRDEQYLKPKDTWGYAAWIEKLGPGYLTQMSEDQRYKLNEAALKSGLVKEQKGTIRIDWTPELQAMADKMLGKKQEEDAK